jgi:hypothetical protein
MQFFEMKPPGLLNTSSASALQQRDTVAAGNRFDQSWSSMPTIVPLPEAERKAL